MNYADIKYPDIANGPGIRVSLFVSGCQRRCEGCFNPEAWDFTYGKKWSRKSEQRLLELLEKPQVAGLSILGGDPLESMNVNKVDDICTHVRWTFGDNKTIWLWTGYTWEDIRARKVNLLKYLDVLVDGPFQIDKKDLTLPYCGSSNQRVIDVQKSLASGEIVLFV